MRWSGCDFYLGTKRGERRRRLRQGWIIFEIIISGVKNGFFWVILNLIFLFLN